MTDMMTLNHVESLERVVAPGWLWNFISGFWHTLVY